MAISEEAKAIADHIYMGYGSDSGFLFGVPPELRHAIEAVVQCVLDIKKEEVKNEKANHL